MSASNPDMDDSIDRQALIDADLDPDDPQIWDHQRWVQEILHACGSTDSGQGLSTSIRSCAETYVETRRNS